MDRVVPWFATVISVVCSLSFYSIQLGAGGVNIAAVVIVAAGIDMFRQSQQVSLLTRVFELDPNARARVNSVMVFSVSFEWMWCIFVEADQPLDRLAICRTNHGHCSRHACFQCALMACSCGTFSGVARVLSPGDIFKGTALSAAHLVWV